MGIKAKEQVKSLLALRDLNIKQLSKLIEEKTGEEYSYQALQKRIKRGLMTYNEVIFIAEILNFKIHFEDLEQC